jgi:peptidoglycan/xylan/chitin deacetylase (PgdA/CDA1 family)
VAHLTVPGILTRLRCITVSMVAACWIAAGPACAQSIALSFDDGLDPREAPRAAAWNAAILHALADAHVHSILFAAGRNVDNPQGLALVRDWGIAGHAVANHTYSHLSLNAHDTTLPLFIADVERNEALLRAVPGWTYRLRFPYLKEGDTAAKRDGMRAWLRAHDYDSGAVSIDASDWYYDQRYAQWRQAHPDTEPRAFREAYLAHVWNRAQYYDRLSQQLFKRSAKHVLLLHTRRINAEFLPDIIAMFRANGWTIISPAAAYADPLYAMRPATLPAGESILWALARQAGVSGLRYPAEDDTYEKPILDRLGL